MKGINDGFEAVLDAFSEARDDPWGRHAAIVSEGIKTSGIAKDIESRMVAASAIIQTGLATISRELSAQTLILSRIEQLLANPQTAAAGERLSRGTRALSQGWIEESLEELQASIDLDRYNPVSHFQLARAYIEFGDPSAALKSLATAARYSADDNPEVRAGAAILEAGLLKGAGNGTSAAAAIDAAISMVPNCPELHLLRARLRTSSRDVTMAVMMEPALGIVAVTGGLPAAEAACLDVATDESGPVQWIRRNHEALERAASKYGGGYTNDVWLDITSHKAPANAPVPTQLQAASRVMALMRSFTATYGGYWRQDLPLNVGDTTIGVDPMKRWRETRFVPWQLKRFRPALAALESEVFEAHSRTKQRWPVNPQRAEQRYQAALARLESAVRDTASQYANEAQQITKELRGAWVCLGRPTVTPFDG